MQQDCPECQRLWRAYGVATSDHVVLENKLRASQPGSDAAGLELLTGQVAQAASRRDSARLTLQEHEAASHATPSPSPEM
jgi:hypothetical protein